MSKKEYKVSLVEQRVSSEPYTATVELQEGVFLVVKAIDCLRSADDDIAQAIVTHLRGPSNKKNIKLDVKFECAKPRY
jgi:hypothetical protein